MELYSIHLFAGAGGGILGDLLLGHTPICAVEIEEYPRRVLLQRQLDGVLPAFPIWDDITTFRSDNTESSAMFDCARGIRDRLVVCGGFPCQDISAAGKGAGIDGERSGLWCEMARVVREVRPRFVFVENSPLLVRRGLAVVLSDLAEMGFDATWGVLGAHYVGAPHKRDRIWLLGWDTDSIGEDSVGGIFCRENTDTQGTSRGGFVSDADMQRPRRWIEQQEVGEVAREVADSSSRRFKELSE